MIGPLNTQRSLIGSLGSTRAPASPSVLGKAASVLRGLVGDRFSSSSSNAASVQPGGALSNPLGGLAQRLVSQFAPALSSLSPSALAARLTQGRSTTTARPLGQTGTSQSAATGQVVTPSLADRGAPLTIEDIFGRIGTYNYPTPNTYNSATNPYGALGTQDPNAVSGYPYPTGNTYNSAVSPYASGNTYDSSVSPYSSPTGSLLSAATGTTASAATAASAGGDFESGLLSKIQGPPPMPGNVKDERQMLEYQRAMQLYTAMVQMVTQVMQMLHEARKNIIQNLRA